jgi:hypothetical protein
MCISSKILFWQNLVSYRGEFWLWKKGEFLGTWSNLLLSYLSIWHIWITFATTWFIFTKQILFPISKSDTILVLCVFLSLTLVLCVVINFIRVRGSNLWRFLTNGKTTLRKKSWYSSGSLERGWVQSSSIGMPQRGSRQVLYLAEPRDKITVSLVSLFCVIGFFSWVLALTTWLQSF